MIGPISDTITVIKFVVSIFPYIHYRRLISVKLTFEMEQYEKSEEKLKKNPKNKKVEYEELHEVQCSATFAVKG